MFRARRPLSAWLLFVLAALAPSFAQSAVTVDEALAAHAANLSKLKTIYVQVEVTYQAAEKPPVRMSMSESWRSGTHERTLQRLFQALTPKGLREIPEIDRVSQFSYGDDETRSLRGWDPEAPLKLPLDETRNANEFGRVKGGIGPRDPLGATADSWMALLLEVAHGQSLATFAKTAQLAVEETKDPNVIRLKIVSTDQTSFANGAIELDAAHGHLIRRMEFDENRTVAEVEGFTEFDDGIWLPDQVKRTGPTAVAVAKRLDTRVNEPILETDLVVAFPEGARVDRVLTNQVHLWGKDGPAHTFDSFGDFHNHQLKRMKEAQGAAAPMVTGGANWLLWVNVIGIAALLLLMYFRKHLVQP